MSTIQGYPSAVSSPSFIQKTVQSSNTLYEDLYVKIFSFCELNKIRALKLTCKNFKVLCESKKITSRFVDLAIEKNLFSLKKYNLIYTSSQNKPIIPHVMFEIKEDLMPILYKNKDLGIWNLKTRTCEFTHSLEDKILISVKILKNYIVLLTEDNELVLINKKTNSKQIYNVDQLGIPSKEIKHISIWDEHIFLLNNEILFKIEITSGKTTFTSLKTIYGENIESISLIQNYLLIKKSNCIVIGDFPSQKWNQQMVNALKFKTFTHDNQPYLFILRNHNQHVVLNIRTQIEKMLSPLPLGVFADDFNVNSSIIYPIVKHERTYNSRPPYGIGNKFSEETHTDRYWSYLVVHNISTDEIQRFEFPTNTHLERVKKIQIIGSYVFFRGIKFGSSFFEESSVWKIRKNVNGIHRLTKLKEVPEKNWERLTDTAKFIRYEGTIFFSPKHIELFDFTSSD